MATIEEEINRVQEARRDYEEFLKSDKLAYSAVAVRTIVEVVVYSYIDYYNPDARYNDPQMSLKDCIDKLNENNAFMHNQIAYLHKLRTIGNAGAHQSKGLKLSAFELENAEGVIDEVVTVWTEWCKSGRADNWKSQTSHRSEIKPVELSISKAKLIESFIILFAGLALAIYFTYVNSMVMIQRPNDYGVTDGNWKLYVGFIGFIILVAYNRHFSITHRILSDIGLGYFLVPRCIMVIRFFSLDEVRTEDIVINIIIVVAFLAIYLLICRASKYEIEPGTIAGYKY